MRNFIHIYKIYVLSGFVFISITGTIQGQIGRKEALGAYIYNFAKHSSSPKQEKIPDYNIVLYTEKQELIQEFQKMEKELTISDKKIKLQITDNVDVNFDKTCLIFVADDKRELFSELYDKTKDLEILLVSENYLEKRMILINIYDTEDGRMLFEINKGNLYARKIRFSDELLLMGGTEVDLVELYLNSQKKLNNSQDDLDSVQRRMKDLTGRIGTKEKEVLTLKADVENQIREREAMIDEVVKYKKQAEEQKNIYKRTLEVVSDFNDSLEFSRNLLRDYKFEIKEGDKILAKIKTEIQEKENVLIESKLIIERQRTIVIYFIIGVSMITILFFLLLFSYRDKKKRNMLLRQQKGEITNKNSELAITNGKLIDINEELNATLEELNQVQNQLIHSEKMASLGVLSAGIAHEINNPINFVYAGINSLLRDFEDIEPVINEVNRINPNSDNLVEKIKKVQKLKEENYFDEAFQAIPEIIKDIKIGADRTADIVKGLKSFSRVDKDMYEILNVHEGLNTSLLLLKNKYKNHIEIIKDYGEDIPELFCYPGKINQVFLNLISNAIDSIGERGKIWISTRLKKRDIMITIKDNGCGIPDEINRKLFDPFFTTKAVGKGTGLGLSITYGIIKEHKGNIEVLSKEDKGSEFIVTLPVR